MANETVNKQKCSIIPRVYTCRDRNYNNYEYKTTKNEVIVSLIVELHVRENKKVLLYMYMCLYMYKEKIYIFFYTNTYMYLHV